MTSLLGPLFSVPTLDIQLSATAPNAQNGEIISRSPADECESLARGIVMFRNRTNFTGYMSYPDVHIGHDFKGILFSSGENELV